MLRLFMILLLASLLVACTSQYPALPAGPVQPSEGETSSPGLTTTTNPLVPPFEHIVIIIFENEDFKTVIGNTDMPFFNELAQEYTLLTNYHAIRHPSLPNYIALIGGDTFGIDKDCNDCFIAADNLADLIEASGRSWKTYQEDMPQPCYLGDQYPYAQKHNPFLYFDSIRLNTQRCERSVVPLTELGKDLQAGTLPDFMFISPNLCNDAHDCELDVADNWLANLLTPLFPALDQSGQPYLVVLAFDEGERHHNFFGLQKKTGGQIPVVLISPVAKNSFQDDTPYTHYSLLKTISESWGLAYLGHAADESNLLMTASWK